LLGIVINEAALLYIYWTKYAFR